MMHQGADAASETGTASEKSAPHAPGTLGEPSLEDVADALARHVEANGAVRPGVAAELRAEKGWHGRLMDVLAVLTDDAARMGYLVGGRKPDEVMTWLPLWTDSPFSIDDIRSIVTSAGWDPEPFGVVVRNGLLDRLVHRPDGSLRRVRGELAGAWLSDQFALSDDEEILGEVQALLAADTATSSTAAPTADPAAGPAAGPA